MHTKRTFYFGIFVLFYSFGTFNDIKAQRSFGAYGNYRGYSNLGLGIDFFNTEIGNPILNINGITYNDIFAQDNKYNDTIENKISFSPSLTAGLYIKPRVSFETTVLHRYVSPTKNYSALHMPNNNKDVFYDGYSETAGYLGLAFHKPLNHKTRLSSALSMGASAVKSSWGQSIAPSVLVNAKIDYFITKNISIYASTSVTGSVIKFNAKQETSNDILPTPFFNIDTSAKTLPNTKGSSYIPQLNIFSEEDNGLYKIKFIDPGDESFDINNTKVDNITINNLIALDNAMYNLMDDERGISGAIDNDYEIGMLELMPIYTMNTVKKDDKFPEYDDEYIYLSDQNFINEIKKDDHKYANSSLLPGLRFAGYKPYIHTSLNQKNVVAELDITKLQTSIKMSAPILDYKIDGKSVHLLEPLSSNYSRFVKDLKDDLRKTKYGKTDDEMGIAVGNIKTENFARKKFEQNLHETFYKPEDRVSFAVKKNDIAKTLSKEQFVEILDKSINKITQNPYERQKILNELAANIEGKKIVKSPLEEFAKLVNSEKMVRLDGTDININPDGNPVDNPYFPDPDDYPSLKDAIAVLQNEDILKSGYIGNTNNFKNLESPPEDLENNLANLIPANLSGLKPEDEESLSIFDHIKSTDGYKGFSTIMKNYKEKKETEGLEFVFEKKLDKVFPSQEGENTQNVLKIEQDCKTENVDKSKSKDTKSKVDVNSNYSGYFKPSNFMVNTTFKIGIQISF
ncbi:hypothetical protein GUI12_04350 [Anaplasmataceae bacterium AB001_6]|nr:hypothetical protein GUI12_04350 [Anaplasmataceae bacterium AB001_6]